jgi:hypothetical protein
LTSGTTWHRGPADCLPFSRYNDSGGTTEHGSGSILYFEGNQTATVVGTVQAMTDPDLSAQFVAHLKKSDGTIPRYYQAVLKVKAMDEMPMGVSYEVHRELTMSKHGPATSGAP